MSTRATSGLNCRTWSRASAPSPASADHLDLGAAGEHGAEAGAEDGVVVGDDETEGDSCAWKVCG
jgi:hypothetical protein